MIIQKVLYGLTGDIQRQLAIAQLIEDEIDLKNLSFAIQGATEWDKMGDGSFQECIKIYVAQRWADLVMRN